MQSDFGFRSERGLDSRVFNPELGGGSLLDVGIYPISMASFIFGKQPETIKSGVRFGPTGVDEQAVMIFEYGDDRMATMSSSITLQTKRETIIYGTKGSIHIYGPWNQLKHISITVREEEIIEEFPLLGCGYTYQAIEVRDCLFKGKPRVP